jgi:hypothetical protein
MVELRTDLIISTSTKGFSQAAQDAERLSATATRATAEQVKGFQDAGKQIDSMGASAESVAGGQKAAFAGAQKSMEQYQAEIRRLQENLGELKSSQLATVKSLMQTEKGSEQYKLLQKQLSSTNDSMRLTEMALRGMNEAVLADDGTKEATDKLVDGFQNARTSQRQYRQEIQALKRELQDLAREQTAVAQALGKTEKGSAAYKLLGQRMQDVGERSRVTETRIRSIERATGKGMPLTEQDMAKGAFWQGLMQGAFPGMGMIQRGPGMQQQMAGAMAGRAGRGVVQGAFGGVQGLQQMLAAAPVPGAGVLAAQFGMGVGAAGGGLGQMQARLRGLPMMGGIRELSGQVAGARMAARERALARAPEVAPQIIEQEAAAAREAVMRRGIGELEQRMRRRDLESTVEREGPWGTRRMSRREAEIERRVYAMRQQRQQDLAKRREARAGELAGRMGREPGREERFIAAGEQGFEFGPEREAEIEARMRQIATEDVRTEKEKQERRQIAAQAEAAGQERRATLEAPRRARLRRERAAEREARRAIFRPVRAAGRELAGMPEQQAIQAMQAVTARGGGGLRGMQQQGMLQTAFAAQTAYGIGPEVSGAFLMGGRREGMVGARGRSGELMAQTIGDALSMGLQGWEATEYMQQMAAGIDSFKQTGIPINPRSLGQMGKEFAQTGVGGLRGGVMGRGLMQGLQRISTEGISGGVDLLAAQVFGGFEGGGLGNWWEMQKKLEAGGGEEGFSAEQMREFVRRATEAGRGEIGGMITLRNVMREMGVQMTTEETEQLARGALSPEEMTPEQRERMGRVREQMAAGARGAPMGVADLTQDARTMMDAFGTEIRRTAALQNKQNDIGERLVPVFNDLQKSAVNINNIFASLGTETLQQFTSAAEGVSSKMEKIAVSLGKMESASALERLGALVTF